MKKKGEKMGADIHKVTMVRIIDSDIKDRMAGLSPFVGKVACTAKMGRSIRAVTRKVISGKTGYRVFAKALDHWEARAGSFINKKMICEVSRAIQVTKK